MAREKGFRLLSEDDSSITVIDARGIRVKVDKFPERVMPLYTSFLKLWYECGGKAVARPSTRSAHIPE
ncbi:MAG: hypothetical protein ACOCSE_01420, partial [Chitinivibrionales bacterium]